LDFHGRIVRPTVREWAMNSQTEKLLNTGLTLVRDAGSAAVEKGTSLVKVAGPKAGKLASQVKNAVSVGAAVAIAKKGGTAAIKAARKNPVAVAAGAVVLAGIGVGVAVARKRKKDREAAAGNGAARPKKVAAKNMRNSTSAAPAKKTTARKSSARKSASATKH
jgi:hypothetical protein